MATKNIGIWLTLLLSLAGSACSGKHDAVAVENEEQNTAPRLPSTVAMNDPKAGAQLLSGFYPIEGANAWRWTAGTFSARLGTPPGAGQNGAVLSFSFTVPEAAIRKSKSLTLSASVNGMVLKSATYNSPGPYIFSADVPASALGADSVKVDFALDKTMRANGDVRDLGVVAISVGLAGK